MSNDDFSKTWEECIERYQSYEKFLEELKEKNPEKYDDYVQTRSRTNSLLERNRVMVLIVEQLKNDADIPELGHIISHHTLRLWYPDFERPEVQVSAIEPDNIWIALGNYEQVEIPLAKAIVTIKRYLEKARYLLFFLEIEKDETGDVENELEKLPLEWVSPAALNQILWELIHLPRIEQDFKKQGSLSKVNSEEVLQIMSKIRSIISSARKISREKRSKQWLDELEKDDE